MSTKNTSAPSRGSRDAMAARILPLVLAAAVALLGIGSATGSLSHLRGMVLGAQADAQIYGIVASFDPTAWDECFGGPMGALMPAPIGPANQPDTFDAENALGASGKFDGLDDSDDPELAGDDTDTPEERLEIA